MTVAASAEKGALTDIQVESSRLIVTGNPDFLANDALSSADVNLDFGLSGIDWLLNREEKIGFAPKTDEPISLFLTDAQLANLSVLTVMAIPLAAALAGMLTWWKRRR